jgi:hypothetical protein
MKKHRTKIMGAVVILCLLAFAWFFGGGYANRDATSSSPPLAPSAAEPDEAIASGTPETAEKTAPAVVAKSAPETSADAARQTPASSETSSARRADTPAAPPSVSPASQTDTEPETGGHPADPARNGNPLPAEPQDAKAGETARTVTLSVRCDTILDNMERLDSAKHGLVPADGVIFPETAVTFHEGESAFNVLSREMKRAKVHLEFVNTPIYDSAYIEGINNLYEFDVGELSGWEYKVNDWFPNYGSSRYQLKDGDRIEWLYTCDLGRDIGGYNLLGEN